MIRKQRRYDVLCRSITQRQSELHYHVISFSRMDADTPHNITTQRYKTILGLRHEITYLTKQKNIIEDELINTQKIKMEAQ